MPSKLYDWTTVDCPKSDAEIAGIQGASPPRVWRVRNTPHLRTFPKWREEYDELLLQIYRDHSVEELAQRFGVGSGVIYRRLRKFGLSKGTLPHWSKEDIQFLIENYRTMSFPDLERHLKRKKGAIVARAGQLGIVKRNRTVWNEENDRYLKQHYRTTSTRKLAAFFNTTEAAVHGRAWDLRISKRSSALTPRQFDIMVHLLNLPEGRDREVARLLYVRDVLEADAAEALGLPLAEVTRVQVQCRQWLSLCWKFCQPWLRRKSEPVFDEGCEC